MISSLTLSSKNEQNQKSFWNGFAVIVPKKTNKTLPYRQGGGSSTFFPKKQTTSGSAKSAKGPATPPWIYHAKLK